LNNFADVYVRAHALEHVVKLITNVKSKICYCFWMHGCKRDTDWRVQHTENKTKQKAFLAHRLRE
jgi:hypothetical protein